MKKILCILLIISIIVSTFVPNVKAIEMEEFEMVI